MSLEAYHYDYTSTELDDREAQQIEETLSKIEAARAYMANRDAAFDPWDEFTGPDEDEAYDFWREQQNGF